MGQGRPSLESFMKRFFALLSLIPLIAFGDSAFMPNIGSLGSVSSSTTSNNVNVPNPNVDGQIRVFNDSLVVVYIKLGSSSGTTATTSDLPISPGGVEVLSFPANLVYAAVITSSGTGTVSFCRGTGL